MKHNFLKKLTALLLGTIMVFSMIPAIAIGTQAANLDLTLCTGTLQEGDKVVIATPDRANGVTGWNGSKDAVLGTNQSDWVQYTVGISGSGYTFYDEGEDTYIASPGNSNQFKYGSAGVITIQNDGQIVCNTRYLQINSTYIRFYSSVNDNYTPMYVYIVNESGDAGCEHVDNDNDCVCDNGCGFEYDHVYENYGEPVAATCEEDGSQLQKCKCGAENTVVLPATGHTFVDGVCWCGETAELYELVTDVADLKAGDKIIIVGAKADKTSYYALSTTQANNNRPQIAIDEPANSSVVLVDGIQVIVIEAGISTGSFAFNVGNGYLYASGTGNHLRTEDSITANGSWNITIDESGNATIRSTASVDQNWLRYNPSAGIFSCYASGQQDVQIYKLPSETTEPIIPEPDPNAPVFTGFGLTLNKGATVRVKFNVTAEWLEANPTAKVVFSNGEECTPIVGENTYTTTLTPGQIGNDLTVTLGDVTKTVSVSTYIEKAKAAYATDTKLCTLLDAIDAYGKAAAKVEQTLTAPDFDAIADHVVTDKSVITGFTNVVLAEYATIGLNINAEEGYTFVASRGTATTGKMVLADNLDNGVLYIENIRPANFDDVITVTIYDGDTVVSTIDFTFNSYLKLAYGEATTDLDRNVVIAAYNYGAAAAAYVGA